MATSKHYWKRKWAILEQNEENKLPISIFDFQNAQIDQLEKQIQLCDQEITRLRDEVNSTRPREFTDKSVSEQEYCELKLKVNFQLA